MLKYLIVVSLLFLAKPIFAAPAPDLDDQTRAIAAELRCVVCQNLSVADSPSEMAQQMRGIIRDQLQAGKKPQEIKNYFVSKYGEWVLLAPTTEGFSLLVWVLPFVALAVGLGLGIWLLRRWSGRGTKLAPKALDAALLARVRNEAATAEPMQLDPEDSSPRSELMQDRARVYADLKELEFDFQAGKLSEADYSELRRESEAKAATVLQQLDALSERMPAKIPKKLQDKTQAAKVDETKARGLHGWQLAAGGVFLLLFGLVLGVALTKSLRPRGSEQDTITGDFLTGTGSAGTSNEVTSSLQEGKVAFGKQDWAKAIEAFKKVLASDPNQPEAHAYMGFILVQAGHADGALMAFDKALAAAPNFPMALWGKGMTLYQAKQDYAGARDALEKLLPLMPAGAERGEVEKVLAEIPQAGQKIPQAQQTASAATATSDQITGKVTIDPKLKAAVDSQAVLFIIARPAGAGGGPPLAVKKIDRPIFPVSYSLGSENVMMQGRPFSGKVNISVRLDKDGNPITRQPGDISGELKNPVDVGSKNVDIVLDQIAP
ncbi:MAG TPA: cytochrome c-type biogenesis protein CcmH [Methylomirabilota bacterium]|nr:cytochrome c-type biogenesis protein CcmH [Methylomirabilota bacterium]